MSGVIVPRTKMVWEADMLQHKMPFGPAPAGLDQRVEDWEDRLDHLISTNLRTPYEYGVFDCATFAIDAVRAVTGVSLIPGIERPKPGWLAAAKFLIRHGLDDTQEFATAALGQIPGDAQDSMPGDLVAFRAAGDLHLAVRIRMGNEAITPAADGLALAPKPDWVCSWGIGRTRSIACDRQ